MKAIDFSLLFFASNDGSDDKYDLLFRSADFADRNGFTAVWIPERHFHPFGGIFPNPSVVAAALARTTSRLRLRAGSVVLPLHSPIRVAEEWALVDNLSGGRVDIAFATGWNPNDFVLAPQSYADRRQLTLDGIQLVHKLWRGEAHEFVNGCGQPAEISIFPRPVQPHLPSWLTCTQHRNGFVDAGAHGLNVLTGLLFQTVAELAPKIAEYRRVREEHGHDPMTGRVTLMLHTYLDQDPGRVRERVNGPFTDYLRSSVGLWKQLSSSLEGLDVTETKRVLEFAVERYARTAALIGTTESCGTFVDRLAEIGVDEIACLIDFGVETSLVLDSLKLVDVLRQRYSG